MPEVEPKGADDLEVVRLLHVHGHSAEPFDADTADDDEHEVERLHDVAGCGM